MRFQPVSRGRRVSLKWLPTLSVIGVSWTGSLWRSESTEGLSLRIARASRERRYRTCRERRFEGMRYRKGAEVNMRYRIMFTLAVLILPAIPIAGAAQRHPKPPAGQKASQKSPLDLSGSMTTFGSAVDFIIRDPETFEHVWRRHDPNGRPVPVAG